MTAPPAPSGQSLAVEARGLRRAFGDFVAVDGVDLSIAPGEIYGFLGPNGAGKSTTVRTLCTLIAPSGGTARVAGFDVASQPEQVRLRIGVALQDAALDPKQPGSELLRLQARLYGLTKAEAEQRYRELLPVIDIGDAIEEPIGSYSGGMRRRLDLATALVHNPDILFLDEPTTGLDPVSRVKVWDEVRRLNAELGMTIFLTTQYLEEADELCGRVGIISSGRIVAEDTPAALKRQIGDDLVIVQVDGDVVRARELIGTVAGVAGVEAHGEELVVSVADGAATVGPIAVALHGGGVGVRNLALRTPTLDDVFLELTGNRIRPAAGGDTDPTTPTPQEA